MAVYKVSKKNKINLFNSIKKEENAFGKFSERDGFIPFLNEIWDLENLPSEDDRFSNALEDTIQHTINNDDWDIDYLFIERFRLFDKDDIFIKFLETVVDPRFRENEDDIVKFVLFINSFIEQDDLELYRKDYNDDGLPVYLIQRKNPENLSIHISKNSIPFYVQSNGFFYNKIRNLSSQKNIPAFVLSHNNGWNDFGFYTLFYLFYYDEKGVVHQVGDIKIMSENQKNTSTIPDEFFILEKTFCSLGQDITYYKNLKKIFGRDFESVLFALKDAAFFNSIQEKYENNDVFITSLIRDDFAERLLRQAKYVLYDFDLSNLYSFKYFFKPNFSKEILDIDFNFNNQKPVPNRVYGIIGNNGTGKTQLITTLPKDISLKKDKNFSPRTPLFSKIIAVSYSVFDNFEIPKKTETFNYVYCGIRTDEGDSYSKRGLTLRFHHSWKKIKELKRMDRWRNVLLNFIDDELVDEFIVNDLENDGLSVDITKFGETKNKLSSGQSIILFIITEIVANIRFDSILLFDEPETHLHPNAITQLVNTIYELVNQFESYCIITTHSPLIIREIFSKNVYVLEKHETVSSIRKISIESFGENTSILTEEVFGNKEIPKHYKTMINELVSLGYTFEGMVSIFESDNIPLSLNAKIYIKSLISNHNA